MIPFCSQMSGHHPHTASPWLRSEETTMQLAASLILGPCPGTILTGYIHAVKYSTEMCLAGKVEP